MDKICLLLGWGVARSSLFLLEDQSDDIAFRFFVFVNGLSFFAHLTDAMLASMEEQPGRVPSELLYGLSCVGGSPAASLAMVVLQSKREDKTYNLAHAVICVTQNLVLMSLIHHWHGYSLENQIQETGDELQYTANMMWHNLLSRFSWNTRKYRHSGHSATQFFNTLYDLVK